MKASGFWAGCFVAWLIAFSLAVAYSVRQGWQAHDDLCAIRANYQAQIRSSEGYLQDVKDGRRKAIPGITTRDITTSLNQKREFVAAIHC